MKTDILYKKSIPVLESGNYYGGLHILNHNEKYYSIIENWDTEYEDIESWDEIDKELYDALIAFQNRLKDKK